MNILAVDTSGSAVGIAALECDAGTSVRLAAVLGLAESRQLSRHVMSGIDAALQRAGWTVDDVDAVAVGLGPGSWTGLRIGLTTCKTLAQVRDWMLAGVPTYDAMAQAVWRRAWQTDEAVAPQLPEHFMLLVTGPCRPGEVYGKIFECHQEYLALVQPEWIGDLRLMLDTVETESLARDLDAPMVLTGPGSDLMRRVLEERQQPYFVVASPIESVAVEVGLAGAAALASGDGVDPLALTPLYLAPSAAERNLLKAEAAPASSRAGVVIIVATENLLEAASPVVNKAIIRRATVADLPVLEAIEQASFPDPWAAESIADSITEARTVVLVAVVAGSIRGYGVAWTLGDEGDIMHLAVAPAWRRCGLGHLLLQSLLDACAHAGARQALLEVRRDNHSARRLYERRGFVEAGRRRRYYRDGADAVTMQLTLLGRRV